MTPAAAERMYVYQEGQRAAAIDGDCPYSDWRVGTWAKGFAAARQHYWEQAAAGARKSTPEVERPGSSLPVAWRYWKDKFACWEYSDGPPDSPAGAEVQALYLAPAPDAG